MTESCEKFEMRSKSKVDSYNYNFTHWLLCTSYTWPAAGFCFISFSV